MNLTISIPAAILALPGLTLHERAALAFISEHPRCRNITLARHLGVSVRGAEAMLRRLRQLRYIRSVGIGRARCLELLFPVERHTKCGVQQKEKSHTKRGVEQSALALVKREPSTQVFAELHLTLADNCMEQGLYKAARRHLEMIRARVEQDTVLEGALKSDLIGQLTTAEDRCFAFEIGAKLAAGRTASEQQELALTLARANAEKLAVFRQKVEAGALLNAAVDLRVLTDA